MVLEKRSLQKKKLTSCKNNETTKIPLSGDFLLVLIAFDGIFNDLFGDFSVFKGFDFGGAGFLEIFVVVKMELNLFQGLSWEILESIVSVAIIAVVGWDADDLVVYLAAIDEFHDAEDFGFHPDAGGERLVGNHQYVKLVAVFVESLRDKAVVTWLSKSHWLDTVEHEASVFAVPFDFMIAAGRDFDHDVKFAIFVITGCQNFIEVCHNSPFCYMHYYNISVCFARILNLAFVRG